MKYHYLRGESSSISDKLVTVTYITIWAFSLFFLWDLFFNHSNYFVDLMIYLTEGTI